MGPKDQKMHFECILEAALSPLSPSGVASELALIIIAGVPGETP